MMKAKVVMKLKVKKEPTVMNMTLNCIQTVKKKRRKKLLRLLNLKSVRNLKLRTLKTPAL